MEHVSTICTIDMSAVRFKAFHPICNLQMISPRNISVATTALVVSINITDSCSFSRTRLEGFSRHGMRPLQSVLYSEVIARVDLYNKAYYDKRRLT